MKAIFAAAMLLAGTAHAAEPSPLTMPIPPITDEQLNAGLEMGQEIEARVDGDLNGDGDPDTVYVVASPDERIVNVVLSVRTSSRPARRWAAPSSSSPTGSAPRGCRSRRACW